MRSKDDNSGALADYLIGPLFSVHCSQKGLIIYCLTTYVLHLITNETDLLQDFGHLLLFLLSKIQVHLEACLLCLRILIINSGIEFCTEEICALLKSLLCTWYISGFSEFSDILLCYKQIQYPLTFGLISKQTNYLL